MWPCGFTGSRSSARCGVVVSTLLLAGGASDRPAPLRLAIYYGYPSLVNGARGDLSTAVAELSHYDVLVLGDGLEFDTDASGHAGREEHLFTARLLRQLARSPRRPSVFGYIDLGRSQALPPAQIVDRIERWAAMGAGGVFLDEAGYDFGVTRQRQNDAVAAAHRRGLRVCVNAFRPQDVFGEDAVALNAVGGGNPDGTAPLLSSRDAILLESFAFSEGVAEPAPQLLRRTEDALAGRRRFGTQVFAIATGHEGGEAVTSAHQGWSMASRLGLDAYGWSTPGYGAAASRLPFIAPPVAETSVRRGGLVTFGKDDR